MYYKLHKILIIWESLYLSFILFFNFLFYIGVWLIWASLVDQMGKNLPAMQETGLDPWVGKIPWRRAWQQAPVFFPGEFHAQRSPVGYSP